MVRGLNSSTPSELDWLSEFANGMLSLFLAPPVLFAQITSRFPTAVYLSAVLQVQGVWKCYGAQCIGSCERRHQGR